MTHDRRRRCERCDGFGRLTAHSVPCIACNGEGSIPLAQFEAIAEQVRKENR
jgi:DnaJ-class molecular chaperone